MRDAPSSEAGFAIVEVMVSAIVAVSMAAGIFMLLSASANQSSQQRKRASAYSVAQTDQSRLRGLRLSTLNRLDQTRTVPLEGTTFTVVSKGQFINDTTSSSSCGSASASADYVKVSSTVTWPKMNGRPPVELTSLIAAPTGTLDPNHGTITIFAQNAQAVGIGSVGLSATGAGTFSGSTDSSGCAQFADQQEGNYTLTPTAAGRVDKDGLAPAAQTVSVIAGTTTTTTLQYDFPGTIPVRFTTRRNTPTTIVNSNADSLMAFNSGMTQARMFGTPGGTRTNTRSATSLFPFTSSYSVYAGSCTGNNPTNAPGVATATVPPGGTTSQLTVQLPALNLTVKSGSSSSSPGSNVNNAHVVVYDLNCSVGGSAVKRVLSTNSSGLLVDPGLPYSTYAVCADNGSRLNYDESEDVKNFTTGTVMTLYLSGSGSVSGTCP